MLRYPRLIKKLNKNAEHKQFRVDSISSNSAVDWRYVEWLITHTHWDKSF